jgi:hypothetical protein
MSIYLNGRQQVVPSSNVPMSREQGQPSKGDPIDSGADILPGVQA